MPRARADPRYTSVMAVGATQQVFATLLLGAFRNGVVFTQPPRLHAQLEEKWIDREYGIRWREERGGYCRESDESNPAVLEATVLILDVESGFALDVPFSRIWPGLVEKRFKIATGAHA